MIGARYMGTKTKVLFFGTHPSQFNGYSKVVYELSKCLAKKDDIELTIWGFQNYYKNEKHRADFPANVFVYDAFANEEPKGPGFGIDQIEAYVRENKPDVCIVYNDMMVLSNCMAKIRAAGVPTKVIAYVDQVYLSHKREFIDNLNKMADMAIAFTPYWEKVIKEHDLVLPTGNLPHGFNSDQYFPIPKDLARRYFNLGQDDFIILNANRNQPRKRWDICIKAFAELVSRYPTEPIKLLIGTEVNGAWNLIDIYQRELKKRNIGIQEGMKHIILVDRPQKLTDEELNILYNCADVGVTTTVGEGFGMISYEMAGIGIPQVLPRIGGFLDMFTDDNAYMCDPVMALYQDAAVDGVGGEQLYCDYSDFTEGMAHYFNNRDVAKKHGAICRDTLLTKYRWTDLADKLYDYIRQMVPAPEPVKPAVVDEDADVKALSEEVEKIDIESITKIVKDDKEKKGEDVEKVPAPATKTIGGKRVKASKGKAKARVEELKALRKKLESLLEEFEDSDDESEDEE